MLIVDSEKSNLSIGKALELKDISRLVGTSFAWDSKVVVLKQNSILRRPVWYETNTALDRFTFDNTMISPGDVIWFPAIR
jgi:hypothetical protein